MCRLFWNLGASTSWNPMGLYRPVMGLLYLFTLYDYKKVLTTLSFNYTSCTLFVFLYDTVMMVAIATKTCVWIVIRDKIYIVYVQFVGSLHTTNVTVLYCQMLCWKVPRLRPFVLVIAVFRWNMRNGGVTLTRKNRITGRKTSSCVTFSIPSLGLTRKRTQDSVVRGRRL
jgi:hypothetical protein